MKTIVVVCWGNIFRSPVAEILINRKINELGISQKIKCISRGIQGQGNIPSPKFRRFSLYTEEYALAFPVLAKHDINIGDHESQPIESSLLGTANLIIAMDKKVMYDENAGLVTVSPEIADKVVLLDSFMDNTGIEDPAESTSSNKYEEVVSRIILAVELIVPLVTELARNQETIREIILHSKRRQESK